MGSADSGNLPQKPERCKVTKPAHVPVLDLELMKQKAAEEGYDEEDDEASGPWSVDLAFPLGPEDENPDDGAIMRVDVNEYASLTRSVEALNQGVIDCPSGLCIVYSNSSQLFFLVVREDRAEDG